MHSGMSEQGHVLFHLYQEIYPYIYCKPTVSPCMLYLKHQQWFWQDIHCGMNLTTSSASQVTDVLPWDQRTIVYDPVHDATHWQPSRKVNYWVWILLLPFLLSIHFSIYSHVHQFPVLLRCNCRSIMKSISPTFMFYFFFEVMNCLFTWRCNWSDACNSCIVTISYLKLCQECTHT